MSDKNRNDLYDPPPYGFKWHVQECDPRQSTHERCSVKLFLPAQLANALVQQKAEAEDARYQKILDERAALDKQSSNSRLDTSSRLAPAGIKTSSSDVISMEQWLASGSPKKPPKINLRLKHQVYSIDSAMALLNKAKSFAGDKELRKRDEELGKQLVDAGPYRSFAQPGGSNHKRASDPWHRNSKRSKLPLSAKTRLRILKIAFDGLRLSHPHVASGNVCDFF